MIEKEEEVSFERTVSDYILIIRDRALPAITLAALLAAVLATILCTRPEKYESHAKILFSPKRENVVNFQQIVEDEVSEDMGVALQIRSQIERLKSMTFIEGVAKSLKREDRIALYKPYADAGYLKEDYPSLIKIIDEGLTVKPVLRSYVIEVSVENLSAEGALLLASRVVREFIRNAMNYTGERNEAAMEFLGDQAAVLKKQLEVSENALQLFRREHKLVSLEDSQNIVVARMKNFNEAATEARMQRLKQESLVNQIDEMRSKNRNLLELSYISNYSPIPSLRQELLKFQSEGKVMSEKYLRKHPRMIENNSSIRTVETQISESVNLAIEDARGQLSNALDQENQLKAELSKSEEEALDLDRISVEFGILKREVEINKKTYDQVLNSLREAAVSTKLSDSNIRVIDNARLPDDPFSPDKIKIAIFTLVLFVTAFFVFVILFELIDSKLKTPWDVEYFIGVNLLGVIPYVSRLAAFKKNLRNIYTAEDDVMLESLRVIYSHAQIGTNYAHARVMLVTSTIPNEGKTTFACNMAMSYSGHGYNTIVVDLDFRRPSLHKGFDVGNQEGCLQVLHRGRENVSDINYDTLKIQKIDSKLSILSSGGSSNTPTELLDSHSFPSLIHVLRAKYDIVIIDTPPVGIFPDALLVGRFVDELIYVCRYGVVPRKAVREVVHKFKNIDLPVLGIVLNAVKGTSEKYGYGAYSYDAGKYAKEYQNKDE